jgi:hypothetical protein
MCLSPLLRYCFFPFFRSSFLEGLWTMLSMTLFLQNYIQSYWVLLKNVGYIGIRCACLFMVQGHLWQLSICWGNFILIYWHAHY